MRLSLADRETFGFQFCSVNRGMFANDALGGSLFHLDQKDIPFSGLLIGAFGVRLCGIDFLAKPENAAHAIFAEGCAGAELYDCHLAAMLPR